MKLKTLNIELQPSYCNNAGKYVGTISYEGQSGNVKMVLDERVSEALLVCIGQTITEFATAAANEVAKNLIASVDAAKAIAVTGEPAIEQD